MRPAEGELHAVLLRQRPIAGIAVDLQHAAEAGKMRDRLFRFAVWRIDIDRDRRIGAAKGPVIAGIGPELAGLGSPAPGIEHRRGRLIGEDLRRRSDVFQQAAHGRAAEARRRGRPSRRASSGRARCPAGRRSAPGDRAAR